MVCFASSPPTPHPLTQSTPTGLSHSSLMSNPHLASRVSWFVCTMVFFASSLPTPHPLTQSTLTGLSHSFTHIKSSPCIKSGLVCVCHGLLCPISPHHLIHSPNPP